MKEEIKNKSNFAIQVQNLSMIYKYTIRNKGLKTPLSLFIGKKKVNKEALSNISFNIERGDIVGYVGLNGAGKTTTIKILTGILSPSKGEVDVLGFNPFEKKEKFLKSIGIVMGNKSQLIWDLPAIDSIEFNKEIYGVNDKDYKRNLNIMVELLGAEQLLEKQVRRLSLGERMKIELIASMIYSPKVIFLDEPTIGLDIISQDNIRKFLKEINSEWNSTIVLTSHNLDDISEVCNKLLLIENGSLCYNGTLNNFVDKYGSKVIKITIANKKTEILEELERNKMLILHNIYNQITIEIDNTQKLKVLQKIWGKYSEFITDISIENRALKDIVTQVLIENN